MVYWKLKETPAKQDTQFKSLIALHGTSKIKENRVGIQYSVQSSTYVVNNKSKK